MKLLEIAMNAKERVGHWAAAERERLVDMMAEARARVEPNLENPNEPTNGAGHATPTMNGQA